jgi:hypothetical protein
LRRSVGRGLRHLPVRIHHAAVNAQSKGAKHDKAQHNHQQKDRLAAFRVRLWMEFAGGESTVTPPLRR